MKKVFALLLTATILASAMVVPSFAAVEKVAGGFDFYSMTIHYTEPVVVDYVKVSAKDKVQMVDKNGQMRDIETWNIATDAIINANLELDGFKIKDARQAQSH